MIPTFRSPVQESQGWPGTIDRAQMPRSPNQRHGPEAAS